MLQNRKMTFDSSWLPSHLTKKCKQVTSSVEEKKIVVNTFGDKKKVLDNKQKFNLIKPGLSTIESSMVSLGNQSFVQALPYFKKISLAMANDPISFIDFLKKNNFFEK